MQKPPQVNHTLKVHICFEKLHDQCDGHHIDWTCSVQGHWNASPIQLTDELNPEIMIETTCWFPGNRKYFVGKLTHIPDSGSVYAVALAQVLNSTFVYSIGPNIGYHKLAYIYLPSILFLPRLIFNQVTLRSNQEKLIS